ncbi:hypothetical protein HDV05_005824 [Chytridiales sp. JEL 0842]|nr:hypothetical protein HDV05_005824 [Chytridiales sp. JEL 0842]
MGGRGVFEGGPGEAGEWFERLEGGLGGRVGWGVGVEEGSESEEEEDAFVDALEERGKEGRNNVADYVLDVVNMLTQLEDSEMERVLSQMQHSQLTTSEKKSYHLNHYRDSMSKSEATSSSIDFLIVHPKPKLFSQWTTLTARLYHTRPRTPLTLLPCLLLLFIAFASSLVQRLPIDTISLILQIRATLLVLVALPIIKNISISFDFYADLSVFNFEYKNGRVSISSFLLHRLFYETTNFLVESLVLYTTAYSIVQLHPGAMRFGTLMVLTVLLYQVSLGMNMVVYSTPIPASISRSIALVIQGVSLFFAGVLVREGDTKVYSSFKWVQYLVPHYYTLPAFMRGFLEGRLECVAMRGQLGGGGGGESCVYAEGDVQFADLGMRDNASPSATAPVLASAAVCANNNNKDFVEDMLSVPPSPLAEALISSITPLTPSITTTTQPSSYSSSSSLVPVMTVPQPSLPSSLMRNHKRSHTDSLLLSTTSEYCPKRPRTMSDQYPTPPMEDLASDLSSKPNTPQLSNRSRQTSSSSVVAVVEGGSSRFMKEQEEGVSGDDYFAELLISFTTNADSSTKCVRPPSLQFMDSHHHYQEQQQQQQQNSFFDIFSIASPSQQTEFTTATAAATVNDTVTYPKSHTRQQSCSKLGMSMDHLLEFVHKAGNQQQQQGSVTEGRGVGKQAERVIRDDRSSEGSGMIPQTCVVPAALGSNNSSTTMGQQQQPMPGRPVVPIVSVASQQPQQQQQQQQSQFQHRHFVVLPGQTVSAPHHSHSTFQQHPQQQQQPQPSMVYRTIQSSKASTHVPFYSTVTQSSSNTNMAKGTLSLSPSTLPEKSTPPANVRNSTTPPHQTHILTAAPAPASKTNVTQQQQQQQYAVVPLKNTTNLPPTSASPDQAKTESKNVPTLKPKTNTPANNTTSTASKPKSYGFLAAHGSSTSSSKDKQPGAEDPDVVRIATILLNLKATSLKMMKRPAVGFFDASTGKDLHSLSNDSVTIKKKKSGKSSKIHPTPDASPYMTSAELKSGQLYTPAPTPHPVEFASSGKGSHSHIQAGSVPTPISSPSHKAHMPTITESRPISPRSAAIDGDTTDPRKLVRRFSMAFADDEADDMDDEQDDDFMDSPQQQQQRPSSSKKQINSGKGVALPPLKKRILMGGLPSSSSSSQANSNRFFSTADERNITVSFARRASFCSTTAYSASQSYSNASSHTTTCAKPPTQRKQQRLTTAHSDGETYEKTSAVSSGGSTGFPKSILSKKPSLPPQVDMSVYRNTTDAPLLTWPKGGPMTFNPDTPRMDDVTKEELVLCKTLRLFPAQYIQIKEAVIGATYTHPPFRKKELRMWFPIDVNKLNKLYDWFLALGWIPEADEGWEERAGWLRRKVAEEEKGGKV